MRIKYYYHVFYRTALETFLLKNHLNYVISGDDKIVKKTISFSIFKDDERFGQVKKIARSIPIITFEYTPQEIDAANFLIITPTKQTVDITNRDSAFIFTCPTKSVAGVKKYHHVQQTSSLIVESPSSRHNNAAFFACNYGFSELFADDRVFRIVHNNKLSGIKFLPVYLPNGEKKEDLFQLSASDIIEYKQILLDNSQRLKRCPVCKKPQIVCKYGTELNLNCSVDALPNDFYVTDNLFGYGIPEPLYIISRRFYTLLSKEHLLGCKKLTPVHFLLK